MDDIQLVLCTILLELGQGRHAGIDAARFLQPPAAEVVAHGDDPRLDAFGHPDFIHEVADLGFDFDEIACLYLQAGRI